MLTRHSRSPDRDRPRLRCTAALTGDGARHDHGHLDGVGGGRSRVRRPPLGLGPQRRLAHVGVPSVTHGMWQTAQTGHPVAWMLVPATGRQPCSTIRTFSNSCRDSKKETCERRPRRIVGPSGLPNGGGRCRTTMEHSLIGPAAAVAARGPAGDVMEHIAHHVHPRRAPGQHAVGRGTTRGTDRRLRCRRAPDASTHAATSPPATSSTTTTGAVGSTSRATPPVRRPCARPCRLDSNRWKTPT